MMLDNCTACEMNIRQNARFCHGCGVPVWPLRVCESCSLPTPARGSFCDQCGSGLEHSEHESSVVPLASIEQLDRSCEPAVRLVPDQAEAPKRDDHQSATPREFIVPAHNGGVAREPAGGEIAAEKRVVTILFADISGFTELSERLEPEEVSEIMNTVFDAMTDVIVENGGTIDKYIGDCLMALFGAPRSYGDDAERAVKSALQLQDEVGKLSKRFEEEIESKLEIRVGLNTGMVVAGFVGGQGHRNYTVMGDAVNLASRMETACARGRVLVASNTQRSILNSYVTQDAGTFDVKGKSKPVQAFYVVRERETKVSDLADFFEGQGVPFFGRQNELDLLVDSLETVASVSMTHAVKVAGSLGSGKSRLLTEFCRLAAEEHEARIIYGRSTRSINLFMAPIRQGLESYLTTEFGSVKNGLSELLGSPSVDQASFETISAAGLELLGCFFDGKEMFHAGGEATHAVRRTLFWALGHLLQAIAGHKVCVLVIADAHLADESLQEFVEYLLGGRGTKVRALICWEMQTNTENLEAVKTLFDDPCVGLLEMKALDEASITGMIREILTPVGEVPAWVMEWVRAQAEGRPLYVLEHLRSLKALNLLSIDAELGTWEIVSEKPKAMVLPPTIHGALQAELDAMNPIQRILLQRAAVVGRVFWDSLMVNVCSGLIAEHKIQRALQALRIAGVLHRRGSSVLEGSVEYRFQSEIFQQVCYDSLVQRERKQIHASVAHSLSLVNMNIEQALLARHYKLGDKLNFAVSCFLVGVESCLDEYSMKDAMNLLDEIQDVLDAYSGETVGRVADRSQRVRYYKARARVCYARGELDEAMAAIDCGFQLLQLPEKRAGEREAELESFAAELHRVRGDVYKTKGSPEEAIVAYREACSRFSDAGAAPSQRIDIQASIAWGFRLTNHEEEALDISRDIISQYGQLENHGSAMANALARHYDTIGTISLEKQTWKTAQEMYQKAKELREIGSRVDLLAHSDGNLACVAAMKGDWAEASDVFGRVVQLWTTLGDVRMIATGQLNQAECLIELVELGNGPSEKKVYEVSARRNLDEAKALIQRYGIGEIDKDYERLVSRL